ncbi:MAG: hypothetical protein A2W26_10225 [Acidobacteria bacterium RBG_16_64_8]|nr:MAG: hypothetical protein A2W26_10225 [Acidobacteria bacterium RBG_16_64_8]
MTIRIYDARGRLVRSLSDDLWLQGPGAHGYPWDGGGENGLEDSPGLYFVRADGSGRELVLRMAKVR